MQELEVMSRRQSASAPAGIVGSVGDNSIETEATVVKLADGIVTIRSKGVHSTQESVERILTSVRDLIGTKRHPMIFDARRWPGGDPAGWTTVISHIESMFTAVAMLVSTSETEIGPFPKVIDRLVIPFRVFTEESDAIAFAKTYVPDLTD